MKFTAFPIRSSGLKKNTGENARQEINENRCIETETHWKQQQESSGREVANYPAVSDSKVVWHLHSLCYVFVKPLDVWYLSDATRLRFPLHVREYNGWGLALKDRSCKLSNLRWMCQNFDSHPHIPWHALWNMKFGLKWDADCRCKGWSRSTAWYSQKILLEEKTNLSTCCSDSGCKGSLFHLLTLAASTWTLPASQVKAACVTSDTTSKSCTGCRTKKDDSGSIYRRCVHQLKHVLIVPKRHETWRTLHSQDDGLTFCHWFDMPSTSDRTSKHLGCKQGVQAKSASMLFTFCNYTCKHKRIHILMHTCAVASADVSLFLLKSLVVRRVIDS